MGSLALPGRCSQGYLLVTVSDQAAMWFGLYGRLPIGSGGCSSWRPQHTKQGRPMQASALRVNEEPCEHGQQGCTRGAGVHRWAAGVHEGSRQRRGAQQGGRWMMQERGTHSATTGRKQGAHATAKGAALSQFIIFTRQQHRSLSPNNKYRGRQRMGGVSPAPCCGTAASRGASGEA